MNIFIRRILRTKFLKVSLFFLVILCYYFGVFTMTLEENYENIGQFLVPEITKYIQQLQNNQTPDVPPKNFYNYKFIYDHDKKCYLNEDEYSLRLVYIVKSACENFKRREAIRKSWGFEKRFSDVPIRTVFILGLPTNAQMQFKIDRENQEKGDIVQASFLDSYYNNTIKTIMGLKWAIVHCPHSKFYFFSDDDMYVSTKNVLRFLRNPLDYPNYLETPFANVQQNIIPVETSKHVGQLYDLELPSDAELFAGYMFHNSRPQRHFSSKWYVSLKEYPFSRYPPYVTAGAYVLSWTAIQKFYYASFYVKHYKFDDIYLALLAMASDIKPVHNDEFYYYKKSYDDVNYKYVVASHGYDNPEELQKIWHEQKAIGNA